MVSSEMLNCKPLSTQAADIMHFTILLFNYTIRLEVTLFCFVHLIEA
jgi:hypothetical protein